MRTDPNGELFLVTRIYPQTLQMVDSTGNKRTMPKSYMQLAARTHSQMPFVNRALSPVSTVKKASTAAAAVPVTKVELATDLAALLETLEPCPVCMEPLCESIYLCPRGEHLLCGACLDGITNSGRTMACPSCRAVGTFSHNRYMERQMRQTHAIPCPLGCAQAVFPWLQAQHELTCVMQPMSCPLCETPCFSLDNWVHHLQSPDQCRRKYIVQVCHWNEPIAVPGRENQLVLIKEGDDRFHAAVWDWEAVQDAHRVTLITPPVRSHGTFHCQRLYVQAPSRQDFDISRSRPESLWELSLGFPTLPQDYVGRALLSSPVWISYAPIRSMNVLEGQEHDILDRQNKWYVGVVSRVSPQGMAKVQFIGFSARSDECISLERGRIQALGSQGATRGPRCGPE